MSLAVLSRLIAAVLFAAALLIGVPDDSFAAGDTPAQTSAVLDNQCLACHSNPARLIPAVREIRKCAEVLPRSGASEGEG